jgi:hypothetical protein
MAKRQLAWETKALKNADTGTGSTSMIALALKNAGDEDWFDKSELKLIGDKNNPLALTIRADMTAAEAAEAYASTLRSE